MWGEILPRIQQIKFDTACSRENLISQIRGQFLPKVVLVNHDKRIDVDTTCSNLAIKYNMLYISVYQLIRSEIQAATELGRALVQSRSNKPVSCLKVADDQFEEACYSASQFAMPLVVQLLQQKIAESRTNQRFIMLEGFCNSGIYDKSNDSLQRRFMDEFFAIEDNIGEVEGVIGLQKENDERQYRPLGEI